MAGNPSLAPWCHRGQNLFFEPSSNVTRKAMLLYLRCQVVVDGIPDVLGAAHRTHYRRRRVPSTACSCNELRLVRHWFCLYSYRRRLKIFFIFCRSRQKATAEKTTHYWQGGLVRAALLDLCQVPAAAKSEAAAQPNCSWRCLKIVTYMYMYQQVKVQVSDTCRGTWLSQVSFEWCSRDETRTYSRGACETRTYRLRYPDRYALEGSLQSDLQLHA